MSSDLDYENLNGGSAGFAKFRSWDFPKPVEYIRIIIDVSIYKFGEKPYYNRVICSDKDLSNKMGVLFQKNYEFDILCDNNIWVFQPQYKFHINTTYDKNYTNVHTDIKELTNVLCVNCKPQTSCLVSTSNNIFVVGTDDLCFEYYNETHKKNHTQRLFGKSLSLQEYYAIKVATNIQLEVRTFTAKTIPDIANISAHASNSSIFVVIIISS